MPAIRIKIEHDKVNDIASAFSDQSDAVKQMAQNLQGKYDPLKGGDWVGEGATKFFNDFDEFMPHVQKLGQVLQASSDTSKKISQIMHQGEDNAKSHAIKIGIEISF